MSFKSYMNNNEIVLLEKYFRNSKNYFEFGAGGSKCCAIKNNIENIESVETDVIFSKDNDYVEEVCVYF